MGKKNYDIESFVRYYEELRKTKQPRKSKETHTKTRVLVFNRSHRHRINSIGINELRKGIRRHYRIRDTIYSTIYKLVSYRIKK